VGAARGHDFSNHNINERRPVKSAWEMKGSCWLQKVPLLLAAVVVAAAASTTREFI
jgi:hypothetical protein